MNSKSLALSMHPTKVSTLVTLSGEVDIANVGALDLLLSNVFKQQNKHLVFDCGALTFIDGCGTRPLVATAKALKARGGTVLLYRPPWGLMRIFDATGELDQFIVGGLTSSQESKFRAMRSKQPMVSALASP